VIIKFKDFEHQTVIIRREDIRLIVIPAWNAPDPKCRVIFGTLTTSLNAFVTREVAIELEQHLDKELAADGEDLGAVKH